MDINSALRLAIEKSGQVQQAAADLRGKGSGSQAPAPIALCLTRGIHAEAFVITQNILNREQGQAGDRLHGQADEVPVKFVTVG